MTPEPRRFTDTQLEEFYQEFQAHLKREEDQRVQQQEMYDALFRKGDPDSNVAPGIVQLMVRTAEDVKALRIAADRQKTFIGGVLFALSAVWLFFTDLGPQLFAVVKKLWS